jgi:hypothetical protein
MGHASSRNWSWIRPAAGGRSASKKTRAGLIEWHLTSAAEFRDAAELLQDHNCDAGQDQIKTGRDKNFFLLEFGPLFPELLVSPTDFLCDGLQ